MVLKRNFQFPSLAFFPMLVRTWNGRDNSFCHCSASAVDLFIFEFRWEGLKLRLYKQNELFKLFLASAHLQEQLTDLPQKQHQEALITWTVDSMGFLSLVFLQNTRKLMQYPRQSGGHKGHSKVQLTLFGFNPDPTLTFRLYISYKSQSAVEWQDKS